MAESGSTRTPREVDALPLLELDEPEQAMAQALEASKPSEQEIVAYYEEHREIFGSRSLEQSRDVVGRIVRHQKAAERLRASD